MNNIIELNQNEIINVAGSGKIKHAAQTFTGSNFILGGTALIIFACRNCVYPNPIVGKIIDSITGGPITVGINAILYSMPLIQQGISGIISDCTNKKSN